MALRDLPFSQLASVFVLSGLSSAELAAMPAALEHVVRRRSAARRRWPASPVWERSVPEGRIARVASSGIRRLGDQMTDAQLTLEAHRLGFAGIPVALILTPTRCVVATAHGVFDGSGSVQLLSDLLAVAAGGELAPEPAPVTVPVLRALTSIRPAELRKAALTLLRRSRTRVAQRGSAGAGDPSAVAKPGRESGQRTVRSVAFRLDAQDLPALRRYAPPGTRGRATPNSRLGGLLLDVLRETHVGAADLNVVLTVDLRHRVPGRVTGNFVFSGVIGKLLADEWSPPTLAARTLPLVGARAVVSLSIEWARYLVDKALRTGLPPTSVLYLSLVQDSADPAPGQPSLDSVTVGSFGATPAPTFVFGWRRADAVFVSVWDESGDFDLDRFESAVRAALSPASSNGVSGRLASPVDDRAAPREASAEPDHDAS